MTNLEKLTQIDALSDLIYDADIFSKQYCVSDCEFDLMNVEKEDCLNCIKKWLCMEVEVEDES